MGLKKYNRRIMDLYSAWIR